MNEIPQTEDCHPSQALSSSAATYARPSVIPLTPSSAASSSSSNGSAPSAVAGTINTSSSMDVDGGSTAADSKSHTSFSTTKTPSCLQKSNSTASSGAQSHRSVESVRFIGTHPLGTLRVVHPESTVSSPQCQGSTSAGSSPLTTKQQMGPDASAQTAGCSSGAVGAEKAGEPDGQDSNFSPPPPPPSAVFMILDLPKSFTFGFDTVALSISAHKNRESAGGGAVDGGGGGDLSRSESTMSKATQHPTFPSYTGVRELPAGPHLFWVSPTESSTERSGVWVVVPAEKQTPPVTPAPADADALVGKGRATSPARYPPAKPTVHIAAWDEYTESLLPRPASRAVCLFAREAVGDRQFPECYERLLPYTVGCGSSSSSSTSSPPVVVRGDVPPGSASPPAQVPARQQQEQQRSSRDADADLAMWRRLTTHITAPRLHRLLATGETAEPDVPWGPWAVGTSDSVKGDLEAEQLRAAQRTHPSAAAIAKPGTADVKATINSLKAVQEEEDEGAGAANNPLAVRLGLRNRPLDFVFRADANMVDLGLTGRARTESAIDSTSYILATMGLQSLEYASRDDNEMSLDWKDVPTCQDAQATAADAGRAEDAPDLVFELQVSFLTALHLGNASCLAQWWHLVLRVVLRAYRLCVARPRLCADLLETLRAQLEYAETYFSSSPPTATTEPTGQAAKKEKSKNRSRSSPFLKERGTPPEMLDWYVGDVFESRGSGSGGRRGRDGRSNKDRLKEALIIYKRRLSDYLIPAPASGSSLSGTSSGSSSAEDLTAANGPHNKQRQRRSFKPAERQHPSHVLREDRAAVGRAFRDLERFLWRWDWDLRGDYVRSGKVMLEDGELVDVELSELEAEDERGEYAAVVVSVDEAGREIGLVRWD